MPVQAAPRAAGSLLTAESSLRQCWELLVPPGYFPASSSLFPSVWVHAKLLLPGAQAALLISSHYPRNLLSGWLVQAVLPDLPASRVCPAASSFPAAEPLAGSMVQHPCKTKAHIQGGPLFNRLCRERQLLVGGKGWHGQGGCKPRLPGISVPSASAAAWPGTPPLQQPLPAAPQSCAAMASPYSDSSPGSTCLMLYTRAGHMWPLVSGQGRKPGTHSARFPLASLCPSSSALWLILGSLHPLLSWCPTST